MNAIAKEFQKILDDDSAIEWDALDRDTRASFQRAFPPDSPPDCILYPHTVEQLAEAVAWAAKQHWPVLPCGSGTKLDWGGIPRGIRAAISTRHLDRTIERAVGDLTVTVEAGMKLSDLQALLATDNQFLALDPSYGDRATLGGIVATADTGSWRARYRGVRDQLLGLSFVRADGELVKAGSRVVKNVAGYDLMKLLTGSFGTLAAIAQVTFRVYPKPPTSGTVVLSGEADAIAQATQTLFGSALTPTAVDLLSPGLARSLDLGEQVALLIRFQSIPESVRQQGDRAIAVGETLGLHATAYPDDSDAALWQQLREQIDNGSREGAIACKIGVRPSAAVRTAVAIDESLGRSSFGWIHATTGIGRLCTHTESTSSLRQVRSHCEANGGFLSILCAPLSVKTQLDIWGYTGNALEITRKIKQKFDPDSILSPHRFLDPL